MSQSINTALWQVKRKIDPKDKLVWTSLWFCRNTPCQHLFCRFSWHVIFYILSYRLLWRHSGLWGCVKPPSPCDSCKSAPRHWQYHAGYTYSTQGSLQINTSNRPMTADPWCCYSSCWWVTIPEGHADTVRDTAASNGSHCSGLLFIYFAETSYERAI